MGRHVARKPCPFCGWEYTDLKTRRSRGTVEEYYVLCCSAFCRAQGPIMETRSKAHEAWQSVPRRTAKPAEIATSLVDTAHRRADSLVRGSPVLDMVITKTRFQ